MIDPDAWIRDWISRVPEGIEGNAEIRKFTVSDMDAALFNCNCPPGHEIAPGDYTKLILGGKTMMSDTQKELHDHCDLFLNAEGSVLVHGLGLGCATQVLCNHPAVDVINVIEINPHVIKLVAPTFQEHVDSGKLNIEQGDAFTFEPNGMYDCVWSDIWFDISDSNLPDMRKLEKKYHKICGWHGFWSREEVEFYDEVFTDVGNMLGQLKQTTNK